MDGLVDVFKYDYKILVEELIDNLCEVECLILGNENFKVFKFGVIDVLKMDMFYDYNNKFVDVSGVMFELLVELLVDLMKWI